MKREMVVKLAQQLGEAGKIRAMGNEEGALFLEEGVFAYCLGEWSVELTKQEGKMYGVDRFEGRKKTISDI